MRPAASGVALRTSTRLPPKRHVRRNWLDPSLSCPERTVFDTLLSLSRAARFRLVELGASDAGRIVRHLQCLPLEDRQARFGLALTDSALATYVQYATRRATDRLFGVTDAAGRILGFAHLYLALPAAEIALSVDAAERRRGLAATLLRHAIRAARIAGAARVVLPCLPDQVAASALTRGAGMTIVSEDAMRHARLELLPPRKV